MNAVNLLPLEEPRAILETNGFAHLAYELEERDLTLPPGIQFSPTPQGNREEIVANHQTSPAAKEMKVLAIGTNPISFRETWDAMEKQPGKHPLFRTLFLSGQGVAGSNEKRARQSAALSRKHL